MIATQIGKYHLRANYLFTKQLEINTLKSTMQNEYHCISILREENRQSLGMDSVE